MNKKFISKVLSVMLVIIVLASQIIAPTSVSAESQKIASFTLVSNDDDDVINRSETVTFIFAVDKGFDKVNGFNFTVSYNSAYLTYEQNSLAFYAGTLSDVSVNVIGNNIHMAWDSDTPVSLSNGQKLFYLRFRVNSSVSTGSQTTVSVNLNSMYSSSISGGKVTYTPYTFGSITPSSTIVIGTQMKPADVVSNLISQIGTVTLDSDCKARIDEATNAYYSLNLTSRSYVSNAQVLFKAIDEYQRLLDESTNIYAGQIAEFRTTHAAVLAADAAAITLADKEAVVAAYNALVSMPLGAQAKLYSERTHLMSLLTRIAELSVGDDPAPPGPGPNDGPTEDELKEADAIIEEFVTSKGSRFEQFLSDGIENIDSEEAGKMITAYEELFTNAGAAAGSELEKHMISKLEQAFGEGVDAQVDVIKEYLGRISDPNYIKLSRYKAQFSSVLSKAPEDLAFSDKTDVLIAAAVIEWLDPDVLAYFKNPDEDFGGKSVYDVVQELLEAASLLEEEAEDDDSDSSDAAADDYTPSSPAETIIEEIIKTITNTVTKTKTNTRTKTNNKLIYKTAAGNYLVKLANRDMGSVVWVLLCLALLSSIIFVVLRIVYHNASKIKKEEI